MKKLLLIALLMLTIVFAAVACKDNTSKPADTTVEDGTTAEPTTTVAPETTAEPETTITETTAPETTVEETTAPETTVEETTAEETTAEETTAEETTAEETTVEETTAEETEPETVVVPENATNVALGAGVNASDAFIAGPWHSDALTDGIWTGVEDDGPLGWLNGIDKTPAAEEVTIVLTLQDVYVLYEASLYPAKGSGATTPGMDFPKAYELMVSEDGENWITVATDANVDATAASDAELQPKVYNFGKAVKAKYFAIKITAHSDRMLFNGTADVPMSIIGEIELPGTVVETEAPAPVEIPDNLTNVALGATVNATNSWTANPNFWDNSYLTDGSWMAIEGGNEKLGWRNSPDSKSPDSFTIILELDEVSTIYQAVLCPERFQSGQWFPKGYDMLVSMDGETWTFVESVTGVTVAPNSETDIPALTYTFDEAVTAKYFCLRITQHSGNTFNGGYGDIEVSAIGEIMLNGVAAN